MEDNHEHEHSEIFKQDAICYFSKRKEGKDPVVKWFLGDVLKCRYCSDMIVLPHAPDCRRVGVGIATEIELEAVNF